MAVASKARHEPIKWAWMEVEMKRRDFLKTTAAVAGARDVRRARSSRARRACPRWSMSATWSASACRRCSTPTRTGYFKDEGLNVQLKFMPNPGDAHHRAGQQRHGHHPQPLHQRLRGGRRRAHRSASSPAAAPAGCSSSRRRRPASRAWPISPPAKGKGLKIGTMRFNTFELTLYRNLVQATACPTTTTTSSGSTTRCRWRPRSRPRRSTS